MTQFAVEARAAALGTLLEQVAAFCQTLGYDAAHRGRVAVVLEELFLNTVQHGFAGRGGPPVSYQMVAHADGTLTVVQTDAAPPFDVVRAVPQQASLERIGGLGIGLIQGLCKTLDYQRRDDLNITTIRL